MVSNAVILFSALETYYAKPSNHQIVELDLSAKLPYKANGHPSNEQTHVRDSNI